MVNASNYPKEHDSSTTIDDINSHRDQRGFFDALSMMDTLGSLKEHDDITTEISIKSRRSVEG
jgi:hypothetical protein